MVVLILSILYKTLAVYFISLSLYRIQIYTTTFFFPYIINIEMVKLAQF